MHFSFSRLSHFCWTAGKENIRLFRPRAQVFCVYYVCFVRNTLWSPRPAREAQSGTSGYERHSAIFTFLVLHMCTGVTNLPFASFYFIYLFLCFETLEVRDIGAAVHSIWRIFLLRAHSRGRMARKICILRTYAAPIHRTSFEEVRRISNLRGVLQLGRKECVCQKLEQHYINHKYYTKQRYMNQNRDIWTKTEIYEPKQRYINQNRDIWTKTEIYEPNKLTPYHLLLDSAPNLGPLICRWEINKFENCWYKSVRFLEVLKLLFQKFLNLSSSQWDMSGPVFGALSNNRWSGGTKSKINNNQNI
jgi:hypothetical protein